MNLDFRFDSAGIETAMYDMNIMFRKLCTS